MKLRRRWFPLFIVLEHLFRVVSIEAMLDQRQLLLDQRRSDYRRPITPVNRWGQKIIPKNFPPEEKVYWHSRSFVGIDPDGNFLLNDDMRGIASHPFKVASGHRIDLIQSLKNQEKVQSDGDDEIVTAGVDPYKKNFSNIL